MEAAIFRDTVHRYGKCFALGAAASLFCLELAMLGILFPLSCLPVVIFLLPLVWPCRRCRSAWVHVGIQLVCYFGVALMIRSLRAFVDLL